MEQMPTPPGSGYVKRHVWQLVVICVVIAVIIFCLVYYFVFSKGGSAVQDYRPTAQQTLPPANQPYNPNQPPVAQQVPRPVSSSANQSSSSSKFVFQPTDAQYIVNYTDSGFSPNNLTIKAGEKVDFRNISSNNMWIVSTTEWPGLDTKKSLFPGDTLQVSFSRKGTRIYHEKANPGNTGTIIVQ